MEKDNIISDELFVREMRIMFNNLNSSRKSFFKNLIKKYFNYGDRADKILVKLEAEI